MSKLLEECTLLQFNKQCEDHELLPDYQYAYRENYSCETALIKGVNDIYCHVWRINMSQCWWY